MSDPSELATGLWCIPTTAANAYLWLPGETDDVVVVDPGLPGDEAIVIDALGRLGRSAHDVSAIVLTHWHADHSGAAPALAAVSGARVLAGAPDAAVLRARPTASHPT
jgi:glyoxylase-like metal-dependent hydrolase (beta-lactamase superfamily II)